MVPVKNILRDFVSMDEDDEVVPKEEAVAANETEEVVPKEEPVLEKVPAEEPIQVPTTLIDLSGAIQPLPETVSDLSGAAPIINLSKGEHRVGFADYNSMFDADEHGTDMVKSSEEQEGGGLEILEEQGTPLTMDDIQDIDALDGKDEAIKDEDYDVLE